MSKSYTCFVALPYANSNLHLGRLGGTFLPADIYRRYKIQNGEKATIVSGIDCYGYGVYLEARHHGVSVKQWLKLKKKQLWSCLESYDIKVSRKFSTDQRRHQRYVHNYIDRLIRKGFIKVQDSWAYYCHRCTMWLDDRLLVNPQGANLQKLKENHENIDDCTYCTFCNLPAVLNETKVLVLIYRSIDQLHDNVKKSLKVTQSKKQITRNFPWGLTLSPYSRNLLCRDGTYYVWIEALYSYVEQSNDDSRPVYFYGKDNRYYHQVIYPQLLDDQDLKYSPLNNPTYCRNYFLKGDKKISGSDTDSLINQQGLNKDILRFVLAKMDTLRTDSTLTHDLLLNLSKDYIKKIVNLVRRVQGLKNHVKFRSIRSTIPTKYFQFMDQNDLVKALQVVDQVQRSISKQIEHVVVENKKESTVVNDLKCLLFMLKPFTPRTVRLLYQGLRSGKLVNFDVSTLKVWV